MPKRVRDTIEEAVGVAHAEDLLLESVRDLVKDEIKAYIRSKIDANPALKEEMRHAVEEFIEAKVKESMALVRIAKCSAKLGLEMIPASMRKDVMEALVSIFEKEITSLIERGG